MSRRFVHRCLIGVLACTLAVTAAGASPPAEVARLRIEPADGAYLVWADNLLAGPIEVRLRNTSGAPLPSSPALPARASVPAAGTTLVARLDARGLRHDGLMQLSLTGVPGSSNARPRDVEYAPPLRGARRIDQGFDGSFSHDDDENRYALDFAADVGTPVYAARAGIVMQVEAAQRGSGLGRGDASRANFIRILHDDGSMALYGHLAHDGVRVRPGQAVQQGQMIGLSGNTGYSTAPHLHFVVQVNRGGQLFSIRFRLPGVVPSSDQCVLPAASSCAGNSACKAAALASSPSCR